MSNMLHAVYAKVYTATLFQWILKDIPGFEEQSRPSLHCILMTEERIWLPEEFIRRERNWVK